MGLDSRDYYRPSGFGGFSFFPPIIKNLLIANIGVFFLQILFGNIAFSGIPGSMILDRYFALNPLDGNFQLWQLISYQFMHADFTHIFFNMFMLWMFGMEIENFMGSRKFLLFYLLSGVGAGILQLIVPWLMGGQQGLTIGASGAVYGVMVAFAMFFPDRYIFIYFLIPIKAKYLMAILVVFEFMSVGDQSLVAHLAHIGGAITGLIFILIDRRNSLNVSQFVNKFKRSSSDSSSSSFRRPVFSNRGDDVEDAKFYEINSKKEDEITQDEIDAILDKISQSGYQKLTEREKRILFEASKKK